MLSYGPNVGAKNDPRARGETAEGAEHLKLELPIPVTVI